MRVPCGDTNLYSFQTRTPPPPFFSMNIIYLEIIVLKMMIYLNQSRMSSLWVTKIFILKIIILENGFINIKTVIKIIYIDKSMVGIIAHFLKSSKLSIYLIHYHTDIVSIKHKVT